MAALASKCEKAFKAYLASVLDATDLFDPAEDINTGKDNSDNSAPNVTCVALPGPEEDPPNTGNFWIEMEILVISVAAIDTDGVSPKEAHDDLTEAVSDALASDTLPADVSALQDDFTIQAVLYDSPEQRRVEDCWHDVIKLRAYCCASDL